MKISPVGVVGFGGYPVVPTMAAARFLNIPYCLHEQNAVLGRANRAMAKKAKAVAAKYELRFEDRYVNVADMVKCRAFTLERKSPARTPSAIEGSQHAR